MTARNKTANLDLIRALHRSKVEFGITLTSRGSVAVDFLDAADTCVFGSLDPSMSGGGITYFLVWSDFAAAVTSRCEAIKEQGVVFYEREN